MSCKLLQKIRAGPASLLNYSVSRRCVATGPLNGVRSPADRHRQVGPEFPFILKESQSRVRYRVRNRVAHQAIIELPK